MFNNWINPYEIGHLIRRIRREPQVVLKIITRLPFPKSRKVKATWAHTQSPPTNWWDVPAVRKRWNRLISGDSQIDSYEYMCRKYWAHKKSLRALVLGCGEGSRVLRWAETHKFDCIDAYDLSESRIQSAVDLAGKKGYGNVINFYVEDVFKIKAPENFYNVIICEGSLHHFSPLDTILSRVNYFLKPDGDFVVNEFVGPTRFQWTNRQMEIVNALLAIFPTQYKTLWNSRYTKLELIRPGKLSMILKDPSEAIESSRILPLLKNIFNVVEIKGYGGTILHLLLSGIAHHFLSSDAEGQRLLDICFVIEDMSLESGEIQDDFVFAVCKKRL